MASGLIIRDASGVITLDLTTRCGRVLGRFSIPVAEDGYVSPPAANQGQLFAFLTNPIGPGTSYPIDPIITVTSTTIWWNWSGAVGDRMPYTLIYGVY